MSNKNQSILPSCIALIFSMGEGGYFLQFNGGRGVLFVVHFCSYDFITFVMSL